MPSPNITDEEAELIRRAIRYIDFRWGPEDLVLGLRAMVSGRASQVPSQRKETVPETKELPVRLMRARNAKGWSAFDLAKAIPCSASVICNIENERNSPTAYTIVRLCKALGISADYLLGLKEEMV